MIFNREPTESELAAAAQMAFIKPAPSGDEVRAAYLKYFAEQTRLYNEAAEAKAKEKTASQELDEQLAECNRQMAEDASSPKPMNEIELAEQKSIMAMHEEQRLRKLSVDTNRAKTAGRAYER